MKKLFYLATLFAVLCLADSAFAQKLAMDKFKGMKARNIGPAAMSGRVTSIAVVEKNTDIIYVGTASGGIWKSESGGTAWKPIFDDQKVAGIGSLAIQQDNPNVIWAGTGEGNPRNSQTVGYGIYKSIDAGKTWKLMGLEKTFQIHRVIIHPKNPDVVYVAAIGSAWHNHTDRGVFKTTNGGQTWEKVLYVNEKTGAADLVIDPENPNKLMAAMWEYRREPWVFKSGGEGSGLYVTIDAGKTWVKRSSKDGLPEGDLGRIGLAIAKNKPNVVYAWIESKKNALYRSEDGGEKWKMVNDKEDIGDRPFYYAEIYVDPTNENRVYTLYSRVAMSEDGGKSFKVMLTYSTVHPDHHAWWISAENPNYMIDGNDGGLNITKDGGKSWQFIENLPLGQFYHINYDLETPYNVYGGLQDNGSWQTPAYVWRDGGIRNQYSQSVLFGDGFDVVPDLTDIRYGYAMSQGGNLARYDTKTGNAKLIMPVHPEGKPLRFNWNAAIAQDNFDKNTIYYGSQYVHKSKDKGETWEIISPDLTTNNPEKQQSHKSGGLTYDVTFAENHTTILTIAASPVKDGILWVGTDDGNIQVTKDAGKTWNNVTKNLKNVPDGCWIPQITASTFHEGEAFVVLNDYRRGNWSPYIFQTKDFGLTWKRLVDENKVWGYALSFVQDIVEPKLMFAGTEFGLYVSIDGGENWGKWTSGYPTVSTMDLRIHPKEHDLIIGTFGRAIYILDDIRPLRKMAQENTVLNKDLAIFDIPDAMLVNFGTVGGNLFPGKEMFQGENRPFGASISYYVKAGKLDKVQQKLDSIAMADKITSKTNAKTDVKTDAKADTKVASATDKKTVFSDSVRIEIYNLEGKLLKTMYQLPDSGVNRITWNLTQNGVRFPDTPKPKVPTDAQGGYVLPNTYQVKLIYKGIIETTNVKVVLDPRLTIATETLQATEKMVNRLNKNAATATSVVDRLNEMKETIDLISKQLDTKNEVHKKLSNKGKAIKDSVKIILELINGKEDVQGIFRSATIVSAKLEMISYYLFTAFFDKPTVSHELMLADVEKDIKKVVERTNNLLEKQFTEFRNETETLKVSMFKEYQGIKME
jgi:photosystem II stability/assembly factor-like uncharacterized protein